MMGIHHFETSTTASWKRSLDRKRPLGYHSNSYSWKGKERTPPFGQTARVCTRKQTNLGFSEGILPRQLEFSFFDGEVNVNFEWSTFCALGRRAILRSKRTTAHSPASVHQHKKRKNHTDDRREQLRRRSTMHPLACSSIDRRRRRFLLIHSSLSGIILSTTELF